MLAPLTFFLFAAAILGSAVGVVAVRNAIISALFLAVSLVSVAGLFVALRAEFLFAAQVLVYTGGIMVLFLFVIMLVNVEGLELTRTCVRGWVPKLLFTLVVFAALGVIASGAHVPAAAQGPYDPMVLSNTKAVAGVLLTSYLLPFEIVSVLLLVAMVGAIVLSKKEI